MSPPAPTLHRGFRGLGDGPGQALSRRGTIFLSAPRVSSLIDECGPPGKVIFLEAGADGLPVVSQEWDDDQGGFELFRVWPLNVLLVHCIALGLLFCLARFPIFGRPRQLQSGPESDFFKHIVAVGEWLEKTGNATYARQLIANYHSARSKESR